MKVKFVQDAIFNGEVLFKTGQEADLPEDKAFRWIRRGVAVDKNDFVDKKKVEVEKEVSKPQSKNQGRHKGQNKQNLDKHEEPEQNEIESESLL